MVELTNELRAPGVSKRDAQVAKAARLSPRAAAIKTADKLANIRDVVQAPPAKWDSAQRRRYIEDARAVVLAMSHRHHALDLLFLSDYETLIARI